MWRDPRRRLVMEFVFPDRNNLEGVVAKWKRGKYMEGDRTSWVKIKNPRYTQSVDREKLFEKRA